MGRKAKGFVVICGVLLGAFAALAAVQSMIPPPILVTSATAVAVEGEDDDVRIFVALSNEGAPDWLTSVSSPFGETTQFEPSASDYGIPIPAGMSVQLSADAAHLRVSSLTHQPQDGELIPIELTFARAGTITAKARFSGPVETGGAANVGLFGIGDICRVGEGEPAPQISLRFETQASGATEVIAVTDEFQFTEHLVDGPHIPGTGHGHLYVGGAKLMRLYSHRALVGALPSGEHEVRVTLNTNDHRAYVVDEIPVVAIGHIVVQ